MGGEGAQARQPRCAGHSPDTRRATADRDPQPLLSCRNSGSTVGQPPAQNRTIASQIGAELLEPRPNFTKVRPNQRRM